MDVHYIYHIYLWYISYDTLYVSHIFVIYHIYLWSVSQKDIEFYFIVTYIIDTCTHICIPIYIKIKEWPDCIEFLLTKSKYSKHILPCLI